MLCRQRLKKLLFLERKQDMTSVLGTQENHNEHVLYTNVVPSNPSHQILMSQN